MISDANHKLGLICSRYGCQKISTIDTAMGCMCQEHSEHLLFEVQQEWGEPRVFVPWEFVAPHNNQALGNHGFQSLARLSERSGLSTKELLAVVESKPYHAIDRMTTDQAKTRLAELLKTWQERNTSDKAAK